MAAPWFETARRFAWGTPLGAYPSSKPKTVSLRIIKTTEIANNNQKNAMASEVDRDVMVQDAIQAPVDAVNVPQTEEPKKKKRKKVVIACVYCRRSHMICDEQRPCSRCLKRNIGHLCHDEPASTRQRKRVESNKENSEGEASSTPAPLKGSSSLTPTLQNLEVHSVPQHLESQLYGDDHNKDHNKDSMFFNQQPFFFSEHAGSEFSSLNEFLSMLDDPVMAGGNGSNTGMNNGVNQGAHGSIFNAPSLPQSNNISASHSLTNLSLTNLAMINSPNTSNFQISSLQMPPPPQQQISDSARDKFFLTAADPSTEISAEERLKQVINAKLEAGLLQPYNYAKGYARLQAYMDNYMNVSSKQRILKPLSIFRPAFRAIARTLKDVDLILVEENFERMLLDYDRVFTSMAIPACLWRRTGEIYRGNKEFASLVEVSADDLKDGKLAIYELMSEESAVNFWEKYGAIAFDKGQKAVLTSCNLRTRDGRKRKTCCFSFTIRRDRYNIPSCIVGNFIPIIP
jgi:hypothetical protein